MADADRNNLKTDHLDENRNQRRTQPRQPGATGAPVRETSPEEARREAEQRLGKTGKHAGPDRSDDEPPEA